MHRDRNVLFVSLNLLFVFLLTGCSGGDPPATAAIDASEPKASALDDTHPAVVIKTSLGEMTVELDAENTPITVDNFLGYVNRGQYDGTLIHQVDTGYMALGGGFDRDRKERPAEFPIRNEAHRAGKNLKGTLAMARRPDDIDSASNQFIFNLGDNPNLDYKDRTAEAYGYCTFGKVTAGEDVIDRISGAAVHDEPGFAQTPIEPIVIESIRRVR